MNNRFVSARRLLVGIGLAVAFGGAGAASGVPEPGISQARFQGRIAPIGAQMRARMTSWHRGCPVAVSDLRLLTSSYVGFDHRVHRGELVVERRQAIPVLHAMRALYRAQFPVFPPAGADFVNRSRWAPGMIHRRDVVVRAFAAIGWRWGGAWHSPKDYQHFSATGR